MATDTITLHEIFQNYFKESFFADIICEYFPSVCSETIKSTFVMCLNLKEPPSLLKIILERRMYNMTDKQGIKNECKIDIPSEF